MKRICVFCGSRPGSNPAYASSARQLGAALVSSQLGLVYGGGRVGLMGMIADEVLARGGEVIGVIPRPLWQREVGHAGLTKMHIVETMHERKTLMSELADGFIAMPGGLGTFEEIFEVCTWLQLGVHSKPCGFLDVAGYYDPLMAFLDRGVSEGFVDPAVRAAIIVEPEPARMLERFGSFVPPAIQRWITPDET